VECPKDAQLTVSGIPGVKLEWQRDTDSRRRVAMRLPEGEHRILVQAKLGERQAQATVLLTVASRESWYRQVLDRNLNWFRASGMLPAPGVIIFPHLIAQMQESGTSLIDPAGLLAQLGGELAVGLAGVGWLIRRDWRATRERLGLTAIEGRHLLVIALGVIAAFALNAATEAIEKRFFPGLYRQDESTTRLLAAHLPLWTTLLLGVAAGFGEEITLRGALQPRLGVLLTSVVFACGHLQYTWYGMLTVALLGVIMGTIRARTNTSTAIAVHAIYDILAVLTGS